MFLLEGKLRRKSFLYLFKPYVIFHEHKLVRTQPPIIPTKSPDRLPPVIEVNANINIFAQSVNSRS